jgi:hypothetical protein
VKEQLIKWAAGAAVGALSAALVKRLFGPKAAVVVAPVVTIVMHQLLDEPIERRLHALVTPPARA